MGVAAPARSSDPHRTASGPGRIPDTRSTGMVGAMSAAGGDEGRGVATVVIAVDPQRQIDAVVAERSIGPVPCRTELATIGQREHHPVRVSVARVSLHRGPGPTA